MRWTAASLFGQGVLVRRRLPIWLRLGAVAFALHTVVLVGCLPSDPDSGAKLVIARGGDGVSIFVVGCKPDRRLEREVKVLIVPRSTPIMSATGSLTFDGSLDDSGSLVISGGEFDDFVAALQQADSSGELRFQGADAGSVPRNRFEFAVPIPTLQTWLADDESFLYRNKPVRELPQSAMGQRCGVASQAT